MMFILTIWYLSRKTLFFCPNVQKKPNFGVQKKSRILDTKRGQWGLWLVEAREKTRGKLLIRALEQFRPKKARPVWSWRQRDKLSTAWWTGEQASSTENTRKKPGRQTGALVVWRRGE